MTVTKHFAQACALSLVLVGVTAIARDEPSTLDGAYTLEAKESDDIDKAIDTAVANMGFVKRSFARGIFKKRHPAYPKLAIAHDANEVVVTLANGNPMRMPIDGSYTKWKREDGEILEIKGHWKIAGLVQTIDTFSDDTNVKDTQRVNDFSLDAGGSTLTLNVRFTTADLGKPISYRLVYQRDGVK